MKIFRFNIIEKEVVNWSTDSTGAPKIDDLLYTNYDEVIQKCFDKTVDFKKKMDSSEPFSESLWKLKEELNSILATNEFYGLRFEEDNSEIIIALYDKNLQSKENTEFYRTRARQYFNFFNKQFTEEEIENIHPFQQIRENPADKSFIMPLREKEKDRDQFTYLEFNRADNQLSTTVIAMAFPIPVVFESISMDKPVDAIVSIQFLTIKAGGWVPAPIPIRKRESLRFFLRDALDEKNFRRNAFSNNDIWIQNRSSIRPIEELNEKFTVQLRRMKILKKTNYIQDGHFIFPMWETTNQKSGLCAHEFALVLKIADGRNFTEPKFNFYI